VFHLIPKVFSRVEVRASCKPLDFNRPDSHLVFQFILKVFRAD
ncbi:unnamed protein product, partial [Staurois parvus]